MCVMNVGGGGGYFLDFKEYRLFRCGCSVFRGRGKIVYCFFF